MAGEGLNRLALEVAFLGWAFCPHHNSKLMKMHEFLKLLPPRPTFRPAHPLILLCIGQGEGAFRPLELTSNGFR